MSLMRLFQDFRVGGNIITDSITKKSSTAKAQSSKFNSQSPSEILRF